MSTPNERPSTWIQDHIKIYLDNPEEGHMWSGAPTLLLTTKGRTTGDLNTTPLIYGQDGDRYLLVASRGGAPRNPGWYRNLVKNPDVEIQLKDDRFPARARTATSEEKGALWEIMTKIWPAYDEYQTKTSRDIPVIVVERQA
ncbi:MAG: nitroreductase [SAR202 cluster bacterium Io17-Chloro-G7]|nr:MAG: nitroreductase [SAR202 cluster bacterium Io17-Chloro-G7]